MQLVRGQIASIEWRRHSAVAVELSVVENRRHCWTIAADETAAELPVVAVAADAVVAGGDGSANVVVVVVAVAGETQ